MDTEHIAEVRRFNRLVTQRTGALEDHFLGRDRPLGESRVLYEIGVAGADLRDVRARLGLDSGYLSRIVQSLASRELVVVRPDSMDERVRRATLTAAGIAEFEEINRRSDEAAQRILAPLSPSQRERLVAAMAEVHDLLKAAAVTIERVDPASRIVEWCLAHYFAELAQRFEGGFDPTQGVAVETADFRPPRGICLVGMVDGEAVACASMKLLTEQIGYIKRMWVSPSVRGLGVGRRMLSAIEHEARDLGLTTLRLDTNRVLVEAIRLYRSTGYVEVEPFSAEVYAHHWFEKQLP